MRFLRHISFGFLVLGTVVLSAQTQWDNYEQVEQGILDGSINLPDDNNYKIVVGQSQFTTAEIANGQAWVYYLIHWSLSPQQLNTSFVLRDTFHIALDGATVTMLASSNPYQVNTSGKQIFSWSVSDLFENGQTKEGHVYFKVRIKPDIEANLVIRNTAFIELQNGDVIKTTTASFQITEASKTNDIPLISSNVTPNPSYGQFTLIHPLFSEDDDVIVFDAFGKSYNTSHTQSLYTVSTDFATGKYYVRFIDRTTQTVHTLPLMLVND